MSPKSKLSDILALIILGVLIHPCLNFPLKAQTTSAQQWTQLYEGLSANTQIETGEGSSPGNLKLQQSQEQVSVPRQVPKRQTERSTSRMGKPVTGNLQRIISNLEIKHIII